jgi:hypothetical protein
MRLSEIEQVVRVGSILSEENGRDFFKLSAELIRQVDRKDDLAFEAPSASLAALWLLRCAHANALGLTYGKKLIVDQLFENRLLGFRGQASRYEKLTPSLFRMPLDKRRMRDVAFPWFHAAISAWHSAHFRYLCGRGEDSGVEFEAALGAAQHYDLGSFLIDWTWDPLVALAFAIHGASPGESVTVYLRQFWSGGNRSYNVLLPPSFLERVWRQRGFFSWHPVPPEYLNDPVVLRIGGKIPTVELLTQNYYRISFIVSNDDPSWACKRYDALMEDNYKLGTLATWALNKAAPKVAYNSVIGSAVDLDTFLRACSYAKIDPPELISVNREAKAFEDVSLMMDYLGIACLRARRGGYSYFKPDLLTVLAGLPWYSWTTHATSAAARIDRRASVLASDTTVDRYGSDIRSADAIFDEQLGLDRPAVPDEDCYWCLAYL